PPTHTRSPYTTLFRSGVLRGLRESIPNRGPLPSRSRHHLELPRPPDRARVDVYVPPRSPDVGRDGARPDDGGHGYDDGHAVEHGDRKSTRLNSSHVKI